MAFFAPYKPPVRQEGFDPAAAPPFDLFAMPHSHFLPDPFRKFPSAAAQDAINFDDELASLIAHPPPSNERSTHSPIPSGSFDENSFQHARTIFDISAAQQQQQQQPVPLPSSASSSTSAFSTHFGNAPATTPNGASIPDFGTPHFNPSSLRYEQHPDAPPSSYHFANNRHTPSPSHQQHSRSRSRSRPPSSGSVGPTAAATAGGGGVGPARTTRSRRNNSVSSTSPPPPHGRPQAIVIPRSSSNSNNNGSALSPLAGGFVSSSHPASDYSLSEPHSHHGHHHHHSHSLQHHHPHHGYTTTPPFSSSTPNGNTTGGNGNGNGSSADPPLPLPPPPHASMHLPPVSALHHPHSHSLPKSASHHFSSASGGGYCGLNGLPALNGLGALGSGPPNGAGGGGGPASPVSPSSAGPPANGAGVVAAAMTAQEKQAAIANEKRRRRRESHNAVERRRRDNINEKISELATLIPECMLEPGGNGSGSNGNAPNGGSGGSGGLSPLDDGMLPSPLDVCGSGAAGGSPREGLAKKEDVGSDADGVANGVNGGANGMGVVKANKGMILRKSVEYIRYLQQLVSAQGARNRELEAELKAYRVAAGISTDERKRDDSVTSASPARTTSSGSENGNDLMLHDEGQHRLPPHLHSGPGMHPLGNGLPSHGLNHHNHGHGHVRGTSTNGYGSFGGMFGLPSMPEGGESSEDIGGGDDMDDGLMEGIEDDENNRDEEDGPETRGRTRVKGLVGVHHHVHLGPAGSGKIVKEEHEVEMDA